MSDLLSNQQVSQIRKVFHDLSDTFAFPVIIRRTTFANGAFRTLPSNEDFSFNAIREFTSEGENDQFRNDLGPDAAHERKIYLNWDDGGASQRRGCFVFSGGPAISDGVWIECTPSEP